MMQQSMCRMRAANGGRSGRMRMPVQESASTQIAARILADVKSHLSAEHASKAAVRAQAASPSAASGSRAGQASLGQPSPQVIQPAWIWPCSQVASVGLESAAWVRVKVWQELISAGACCDGDVQLIRKWECR